MLLTAGCWFSWLSPQPWTCRPAVRRIAALRHPTRVLGRGGQSNDAPGFSEHCLRPAHRRGCLRGDSVRSDFSGAPGLSSWKPFWSQPAFCRCDRTKFVQWLSSAGVMLTGSPAEFVGRITEVSGSADHWTSSAQSNLTVLLLSRSLSSSAPGSSALHWEVAPSASLHTSPAHQPQCSPDRPGEAYAGS